MILEKNKENDDTIDFVIQELRAQSIPRFDNPPIDWSLLDEGRRGASQAGSHQPAARFGWSWSHRRLGGFAVAAAVASIFFGLLTNSLWFGPSTGAFAQVRSALDKVESVEFLLETFSEDERLQQVKISYLAPNSARAEDDVSLHILNGRTQEYLTVLHGERTAIIQPIYDIESMRQTLFGAFDKLSDMQPVEDTREREWTEKGKMLREFKATIDGDIATVLVDKETNLPMRVEIDRGTIQGTHRYDVLSGFSFNVDLEESLFAIEAPEDYTVQRIPRSEGSAATSNVVVSSEDGLGPVRFGMGLDEVVQLLGDPERIESRPAMTPALDASGRPKIVPGSGFEMIPADPPYTITTAHYDSRGYRVSISSKDGVAGITCFDARTYGPASRKFQGRTSEGITLGMSKERVKQLLPDAQDLGPMMSHQGMTIEFRDGKCHKIIVRGRPSTTDE